MRNNKGFSLVELIVVIAIMAILAAVAIPTFAGFITKANKASDESYMNDIAYAIELDLAEEGGIPEGYEIQVTIAADKSFTYALVKVSGDETAPTLNTEEINKVLEDYTAKGYAAGKYHEGTNGWEACTH